MSPGTVSPLAQIKALTFDVFGTVVDWRTSVVDELALRAHRKLAAPDTSPELRARLEALAAGDDGGWPRFAQAWRKSYAAFTRSFDPSRDAWRTVDQHHRESLAVLLREWGLGDAYSDAEVESLSLVWHRLSPWPDSAEGLHALGSASTSATTTTTGGGGGCGLVTATLSNGNLALLRDLDDFGALGFRELLSAETFGAYKPSPATYLGATHALGLEPGQVAMVAAHLGDLAGARACGLRTVYVERPCEEAWARDDECYREARQWVDLWVTEREDGLRTVASRLRQLLNE